MKAVAFLIIVLAALVIAENSFDAYQKKYGKNYKGKDDAKKAEKAYNENMGRIEKHNKNPSVSYVQGPNENSDRAPTAQQSKGAPNVDMKKVKKVQQKVKGLPQDLPKSINHESKLPAVVDQKTCRSDYIHSILAIYSFISKKKTVFSAQDLIDCDKDNWGCLGGNPVTSMFYIQKNGLSDGNKYKYVAKNQTCQKKTYPTIMPVKLNPCGGLVDGKNFDVEFMKGLVARVGPITVLMNANMESKAFYNYKAGIFSDKTCSKNISMSDTFVTIVGYGEDAKHGPFWNVRNSFGSSWGEQGYFRIKRNVNMCGIENLFLTPC